jgi:hypothetical protein
VGSFVRVCMCACFGNESGANVFAVGAAMAVGNGNLVVIVV